MPAKDYDAFDVGDLGTRLQLDINDCQKFFTEQIIEYAYHLSVIVVYGLVLLFICWPLALFGFAMIPLSFLLTKTLKKKGGKVSEEYRNAYGKYEGFVHTSLQSWREVKTLGMEKQESDKFTAYWDKLSPLFVKQEIFWYLNRGVIAFKDLFITRMNLYFLGGLLIFNGYLSVGDLLVFMVYYETLFASVGVINDLDISIETQRPSINRVLEILGRDDDSARIKKLHGFNNALVFSDVTFAYGDKSTVLHNVNLSIKVGERIAIVGKSGSGKTTLSRLMLNLYEPNIGTVMLDGVALNELDKQSFHHIIGHVAQEPYLLNLSIRDNLLMADSNASDVQLDEVCKMAQIYDFINSLPEKYDTLIGERGIKLSGGQKQRLAIARALLANTSILIFDEATSALDYEAEELVQKALDVYSRGRTVVTIAHRFSAVKSCTRIIVVDDGCIIADGSHDELIVDCRVYRTLFASQIS
ncbi:atp-dependent permease mdl1 mitochondrial [Holotrichia oblita]|nr:atp-dependent permease mdl1 mitochondrial [Holotrichia oblita]